MALKLEPKKRDGETVVLRFAYTNKTRKYFSTGVIIPISDFKSGVLQKPVKSSHPNAAHLNRLVDQVYSKIMSIQSQLLREDKVPTADLVHQHQHHRAVWPEIPIVLSQAGRSTFGFGSHLY